MTTVLRNEKLNGIEIKFDKAPIPPTRKALKDNGFRWHSKKQLWYAKATEENERFAMLLCGSEVKPMKRSESTEKKEKVNKYGVKVGDLFSCSWGYEQTNVNFFQVIGLKGESSVLIREVSPKMVSENPTCGMAADRAYEVPDEILPPSRYSTFVEDNENGDLKRVSTKGFNGPFIKVGKKGSYQDYAFPYNGEVVYESWYY